MAKPEYVTRTINGVTYKAVKVEDKVYNPTERKRFKKVKGHDLAPFESIDAKARIPYRV